MRYERLLALGAGGMATVELALATGPGGFNRLVVLKSTRKDLNAQDETYRMFLEEARLSARLNHPNVVQVSEVLETTEGVVLVMEYLDGLSLSGAYRTANESLTLPMRLRVICEVLSGLHYAHELSDFQGQPLGIVHRDVSPPNVFITYDGRIKLLDFGIAKATGSGEQTRAGMIKGRLAYMPVEQLKGGAVDRRTDVYAVGCLLWESIAGTRLWADQTERDIARSVLSGRIPLLSSRVKVDPALEAIVNKATLSDPNARYASADAMRTELERYLATLGPAVTARDVGDMLSRLSGEARERRRAAIADAIAALEAGAGDGNHTDVSIDVPASQPTRSSSRLKSALPSGTGSGLEEVFGPSSGSAASSARRAAREASLHAVEQEARGRSRRGLFLLLAACALAGFAIYWFGLFKGVAAEKPIAAVTPSARATPAVESVAATTRFLRVDVTPRDARVFIDERLVAGNPAVASVSAGAEHVIRIERDGYEPTLRRLVVTDDIQLDVSLPALEVPDAPVASGATKSKGRTRVWGSRVVPAAPPPVSPPPSAAAAKNCDPPYFFANGNKTYKPECI